MNKLNTDLMLVSVKVRAGTGARYRVVDGDGAVGMEVKLNTK